MTTKPKTLYITPATMPPRESLRTIRSRITSNLLAFWSDEGLYLLDRKTKKQHFLKWEDVRMRESEVE